MTQLKTMGGSFLPEADYVVHGDWTFDGDVTFLGSVIDTGTTLASPVITGTVTGGASYTAPTLTAVTITGTSTIGAGMTITAPAIVGATITGTVTIANGSTITTPVLSGTVTGTYTLGGTPTLASAAGVPYVAGVAASYKLARSAAPVAVTTTNDVTTGLTSVIAAGCNSESALDGDTIANCSVTITGGAGHILLQTWKVTTGGAAGNPTLIAGTVAKNITWWAIGT